jgi:hypothetical protein
MVVVQFRDLRAVTRWSEIQAAVRCWLDRYAGQE